MTTGAALSPVERTLNLFTEVRRGEATSVLLLAFLVGCEHHRLVTQPGQPVAGEPVSGTSS